MRLLGKNDPPRLPLFVIAACGMVLGAIGARSDTTPPLPAPRLSVLLIVVDGLGAPETYARDVKTPNLDRLAALGRRFDRAYSQYPEKGPSRASFLSGWRPESTLVWRDKASLRAHGKALVPLQKHFRVNGYFVARVGEIYGGRPESEMVWDLVAEPSAKGGAEWAALRAAQILAEKTAKPLFLAVGFERPAGATALDKYAALHPAAGIRLAADAAARPVPLPAIALPGPPDRAGRPGGVERPPAATEERLRQERAAYYAYVAWLDAQLGVLLEKLDLLKIWDRTAVALAGDCAPYLGGHGAFRRGDVLFEETLRTALVLAAPGLAQPGAPSTQLVELVDLYPTLVDLAGLPEVKGIEGTSLAPTLTDPEQSLKTAAFSALRRVAGQLGRSVRTERYRYTEWPDGSEELYDHANDAGEFTNLAMQPAHAGTVAELKKLLASAENPPSAQSPPTPARPRGGKKPNVLLIVADDMNARLGCYGYDVVTPNVDRLARKGRRFDRAYCQVAMCSPSRTSLLTGRRPERLGIWDNLDPPMPKLQGAVPLQEHFKAQGYFTARVGKIFHQSFDPAFKWDVAEHAPQSSEQEQEEEEAPEPRRPKRRGESDVASWSVPTERPDDQEPDGLRARRVAQLIEQHKDRPFFIALGFAKPHLRWVAPRKYFDLYPAQKVRLTEEPPEDWLDIPQIAIVHEAVDHPRRFLAGALQPDDQRREGVAGYSAAVSFVDAQLGVVLDALDRLELWDQTIVVVTGDHGFQLGEHGGLWRKDTLFEEALRVPLIVWAPHMGQPGVATSSLAELVDLYPTLTELAGLPRPKDLDGTSLVPLLEDPTRSVKSAAFSAARRRPPQLGWSVRTQRYRYTEWPDGSVELYDHQTDPGERTNLASLPAQAQTVADLRRLLDAGWPGAVVSR